MDWVTAGKVVVPHRVDHPVRKVKLETNDDYSDHDDQPPEKKSGNCAANFLDEENTEINRVANWDIMPNEIRLNIVKYMNGPTRRSLQLCSRDCRDLIIQSRLRTIPRVHIINNSDGYVVFHTGECFTSKTFDEAQDHANKVLQNIDYVDSFALEIDGGTEHTKFFEFPGCHIDVDRLEIKVRRHNSSFDNDLAMNMLKQFNPSFLSSVKILFDQYTYLTHGALYDLPQLYLPDKLHIEFYSTIFDDQLLKLNATRLKIEWGACLTQQGVAEYLKKCLNELNTKHFHIEIRFYADENQELMEGFSILDSTIVEHRSLFQPCIENEYIWLLNSQWPEHLLVVHAKETGDNEILLKAYRYCRIRI